MAGGYGFRQHRLENASQALLDSAPLSFLPHTWIQRASGFGLISWYTLPHPHVPATREEAPEGQRSYLCVVLPDK